MESEAGKPDVARSFRTRYMERASRPYQDASLLTQRKVQSLAALYPLFLGADILFVVVTLVTVGWSINILMVSLAGIVLAGGFALMLLGHSRAAAVILTGLVFVVLSLSVFLAENHHPVKMYQLTVFFTIALLVSGLIGESVRTGFIIGILSVLLLTVYLVGFVVPRGGMPMERTIDAYIASVFLVGLAAMITTAVHRQLNGLISELYAANRRLDDTLEERNRQLERSQRRLIETEKLSALGGLVAGMSHEINTPLGNSVTASSHLRSVIAAFRRAEDHQGLSDAGLTDFLDTCDAVSGLLETNLGRLRTLVGQFRQVSVEPTPGGPEMRIIADELRNIIGYFREQLEGSPEISVVVSGDPELVFKICPDCFRQVISQLVDNAIVHAFPDRQGNLRIEYAVEGEDLVMRFRDNGIGIADESVGRIFEPFFTSDRRRGRAGLGLSIVHNVVRRIGGDIGVESVPGGGTTFIVRFPREPMPDRSPGVPQMAVGNSGSP